MIPALLLAAATAANAESLSLDERTGAVLVVVAPTGVRPGAATSALLSAADAAFRAHTDLRLRSPEQAGVDLSQLQRCDRAERLACWVRAVGGERYLLVVSTLPVAEGQDRLSAMWIDAARARELDAAAPRDREGWREDLEDRIFATAAQSTPEAVKTGDDGALAAYFARLVARDLRRALEDAGRWDALGAIAIDAAAPGFTVQVDGKVVGRAERTPGLAIRDVRPGARTVGVLMPGFEPFTAQVIVEPGKTHHLEASLRPQHERSDRALLWAGGAALTAGVALAIAGAVRAGGVDARCVVRAEDPAATCPTIGFASFARDASALPTADPRAYEPGGLLIAPLGLALAGAGATWAAGGLLGPDSESAPWWILAAGLAAGGATYAIAAAAAGGP